ncbi:hypothetical protein BS50DRAFT_620227 [Corynespora cassiicola Philippines]|uniref:Carrier domain-containing protein n=1 Tax=Corynespora cassiicola Philippines TaxID=1448308 RepID=A0A2T2NQP7_CORCC|nr:hypothetical protein BS50DRAFT_620227 [Corynespora cassiicola Philippines]
MHGDINQSVAIIGSSCRLPGAASSPSKLWNILCQPQDLLRRIPSERFNAEGFYDPNPEHSGTSNVKYAYFLEEDPSRFDASFFGIHPREAEAMDPQQRILLELAYEAFESAGIPMEKVRGSKTGVFAGLMGVDYYDIQMRDHLQLSQYHATGTARSILSNRLSYFFDLKGPSITVDTACSSSLVALHLAVQSLRNKECELAVVAGVNLILGPEMFISTSNLHMLSPDGRCKMWDRDADGYARGEGGGVLLLQLLDDSKNDPRVHCVIRETNINSDGKTPGITMPSSSSQFDLITETFERAGLDPLRTEDRCQYFEAHGTGTQAGDVAEAEAISLAFPHDSGSQSKRQQLRIGSAKTVFGHLEGAAGVVGVLKASLAIQNAKIPPNYSLKDLNPRIQKFCNDFCVPITIEDWPEVPHGQPRRACVNSFGFGGTNAHVILESYQRKMIPQSTEINRLQIMEGPFIISAGSKQSMISSLSTYRDMLNENSSLDLSSLAWTLAKCRTLLPIREAFVARTSQDLLDALEERISTNDENHDPQEVDNTSFAVKKASKGILAIFTGQGAQWPGMGRDLLLKCHLFTTSIRKLDKCLSKMPDAPSWGIENELLKDTANSRLYEAELAHPLCTAVQIALVDLLRASGVHFKAVIGHSSGEIAAAYAANFLDADAAIRIAFLRGRNISKLHPESPTSMMAVNIRATSAEKICSDERFLGKIYVAAHNAPLSTTIAGDVPALGTLQNELAAEGRSARMLRVDKAYHSPYILPCSYQYLSNIQDCNIQYQPPSEISWISSMHGYPMDSSSDPVDDTYWVQNLVHPVLFKEAVEQAFDMHGNFSAFLEIGPHGALKSPCHDISRTVKGSTIPYFAIMERNRDNMLTFSNVLSSLWKNFQDTGIDLAGYWLACEKPGIQLPSTLEKMPTYPWDHQKSYWRESRVSADFRARQEGHHQLLGVAVGERVNGQRTWKNVLHIHDIPWIRGHVVQGELIFPATAYISMAVDASQMFNWKRPIEMIELQDVSFLKPLPLDGRERGTEIVFSVIHTESYKPSSITGEDRASMKFTCAAGAAEATGPLEITCRGSITIHFGQPSEIVLPEKTQEGGVIKDVDIESLYSELSRVGLSYTGSFKNLTEARRRRYYAEATCIRSRDLNGLHPVHLDLYLQSLFVAYSAPGDRSIWTPFLPQHIERIRLNPLYWKVPNKADISMHAVSRITSVIGASIGKPATIVADIEVSQLGGLSCEIQIESVKCVALPTSAKSIDRTVFSMMKWVSSVDSHLESEDFEEPNMDDPKLLEGCERISLLFYRRLRRDFSNRKIPLAHQSLFKFLDHILPIIQEGRHPTSKTAWLTDDIDTLQIVDDMKRQFPNSIDLQTIEAVGKNISSVIRGSSTMLEHLLPGSLLEQQYRNGIGLRQTNTRLAQTISQLSHRHPNMRIIEIGGGTGSTTSNILDCLQGAFASYTFTDISSGFFPKARQEFTEWEKLMDFQVLDIEKDPTGQGFEVGTFDVVIASNVLHATSKLNTSLGNVRKLLKPGGYLFLLEMTGEVLRIGFMMCGMQGWWLGEHDGRPYSPKQSVEEWNVRLKNMGFSGVDHAIRDNPIWEKHTFSLMTSQSIDLIQGFLRSPLAPSEIMKTETPFLIVGGIEEFSSGSFRELGDTLKRFSRTVFTVKTIEALRSSELELKPHVLFLEELEKPLLEKITHYQLLQLQKLVEGSSSILWLTKNRLRTNGFSNMLVGLLRCLRNEMPDLKIQTCDLERIQRPPTKIISEIFLRLIYSPEHSRDRLWTNEPELLYSHGKLMIPRIVPIPSMNHQINSLRQDLRAKDRFPVPSYGFRNSHRDTKAALVTISIVRASEMAIRVSTHNYLYLVIATISITHQKVIAFSDKQKGVVQVPIKWTKELREHDQPHDSILSQGLYHLVSRALMQEWELSGVVLLHNCDHQMVTQLRNIEKSAVNGLRVLTSCSGFKAIANSCDIVFHPNATRRQINTQLPRNVQFIVDMTSKSEQNSLIRQLHDLRIACTTITSSDLVSSEVSPNDNITTCNYQPLLDHILCDKLTKIRCCREVSQWSVPGDTRTKDEKTFRSNTTVSGELQGALSTTGTYLLVGMTGQLGQSLCRFMIENGAKYVVLASRNPPQDRQWCEDLVQQGSVIAVRQLDVTDVIRLRETIEDIRKSFPPIIGLIHGAMVLSDSVFANMKFDDMERVFRPKVLGSQNLDDVFKDDALDFFILCSSLSCVVGNIGQSSYAAANMYMVSLAQNRRDRGLPAAVVDLGMIIGVGHMNVAGTDQVEMLESRYDYMRLSEHDIHAIFAQAIICSQPESGYPTELVIGLVPASKTNAPLWYDNPIFLHHRNKAPRSHLGHPSPSEEEEISVRQKIYDAEDSRIALQIIRSNFIAHLEKILQLKASRIGLSQPLVDLGMDSLMAVEVSSRCFSEYGNRVSVLKILSGLTVEEVCKETLQFIHTRGLESSGHDLGNSSRLAMEKSAASENNIGEESLRAETCEIKAVNPVDDKKSTFDHTDVIREAPISRGQGHILFSLSSFEDPSIYNCTWRYKIDGTVYPQHLKKAIQMAFQRHEALRTAIVTDEKGNTFQRVLSSSRHLWSHQRVKNEEQCEREFHRVSNQVYDLQQGRVVEVVLCTTEDGINYLIVGYHHIILDGASWQILLQEICETYGSAQVMYLPRTQYIDYTSKERFYTDTDIDYWKQTFGHPPEPLPLFPFAVRPYRRRLSRPRNLIHETDLSMETVTQILKVCKDLGVTVFQFHLATMHILLAQLTGAWDMCIGMADANRREKAFAGVVGYMTNLIPLRLTSSTDETFSEVVWRAKMTVQSAFEHQAISLGDILSEIDIQDHGTTQVPLFQAAINYAPGYASDINLGDATLRFHQAIEGSQPQDLILTIHEDSDHSTILTFAVQEDLYGMEHAELICNLYTRLLCLFSNDWNHVVGSIKAAYPNAQMSETALGSGNHELTFSGTVLQRILEIALQAPKSLAISDTSEYSISYEELAQEADSHASVLIAAGVKLGAPVCVLVESKANIIGLILGIWKVGAVYVPLDPENPVERLAKITADCGVSVAFTNSTRTTILAKSLGLVNLSPPKKHQIEYRCVQNTDWGLELVAVILYTSGSTGEPKGVLLTHENLKTQISALNNLYDTKGLRVLQQSSLAFDASLFQILVALTSGGSLVLTPDRRDPVAMAHLMAKHKIQLTLAVPSEYATWLDHAPDLLSTCSHWLFAFCGGEMLTSKITEGFSALGLPSLSLINAYGPSEGSISCCMSTVEYRARQLSFPLAVGPSLPHYSVSIIDKEGSPLPIDWSGEICIQGPGVSPGYVFEFPEFRGMYCLPESGENCKRTYRTGDRGRMNRDGSIIYISRMEGDSVVKIRGNRVDTLDVSQTITSVYKDYFSDAVVVFTEKPREHLFAFVIAKPTQRDTMKDEDIQKMMRKLPLPSYMRPAMVRKLDTLPLTTNGKTCYSQLREIVRTHSTEADQSHGMTAMETSVAEIWSRILPRGTRTQISAESDFFAIGGDSILLLKVLSLLKSSLKIDLVLSQLLHDPTIQGMAALCSATDSFPETTDTTTAGIDWGFETLPPRISDDPKNFNASPSTSRSSQKISVLLTGGTGFIGRYILQDLIQSPEVDHVYSLAVRSPEKHLHHAKISIHLGDLAHDHLGLSEEEFRHICDNVDVIIHNGATVSFMQPYKSLRAPNVAATKELSLAAMRRRIKLHYISSASVGQYAEHEAFHEISIASHGLPPDGANGYTMSKWASEVTLERAQSLAYFPLVIHRPATVVGPGASESDAFQALLQYSKKSFCVPNLTSWTGYFDLVPVQAVAQSIVRHVLEPPHRDVQYLHHTGERVPVKDLGEFIDRDGKGDLRTIPLDEWVTIADELGLNKGLVQWFREIQFQKIYLPAIENVVDGKWSHDSSGQQRT